MHKQTDSLFIGDENQSAIVQCHCGMGHYHGQLEFYFSDPFPPEFDPYTHFPAIYYVGVAMPPVCGYDKWPFATLRARIKAAWKLLIGKRTEYEFEISMHTSKRLAKWLIETAGDNE